MANPLLEQRYAEADRILRKLRRVAVAFSAGVDSTLVLRMAIDALGPGNVVAVTGRSDSLAQSEFDDAKSLAAALGAEHLVLDTNELDLVDYRRNPVNRCYYCKTTLYEHLGRVLRERNLHAVVNGTNADDLGDHRPGLQAAAEHRVRSPLAEAGLTKDDVRELSRRLGLPTHDKPASPCLSSRVQYGEEITPEKLRRIEAAESFVRSLGIRECRVRLHAGLARIEVAPEHFPTLTHAETAARLDRHFRDLGFTYVSLDLRGFRSGSLNETIALGVPPRFMPNPMKNAPRP
jgi:uncharacterized protein